MLRAADFNPERPLNELIDRNVIVAVKESGELNQIIDVLYQVRCNVFHGEKVPGEVNDDRIVCAARPLVVALVQRAMGKDTEASGAMNPT